MEGEYLAASIGGLSDCEVNDLSKHIYKYGDLSSSFNMNYITLRGMAVFPNINTVCVINGCGKQSLGTWYDSCEKLAAEHRYFLRPGPGDAEWKTYGWNNYVGWMENAELIMNIYGEAACDGSYIERKERGRGTVATGRAEQGTGSKKTTVTSVEMSKKSLDDAEAGDNVDLPLRGISRTGIQIGQDEDGRHTAFISNYRPRFCFRTANVIGKVDLLENIKMVMCEDNVIVAFELSTPVVLEPGTLLDPLQFSYPKRRLTMEEIVNKFIGEGKREHEQIDAFIREFKTTNELLLKERNNSLRELEFKLYGLSRVINKT
ncbi:elongation factor Tu, mitochondrial [Tanacetum coccineum]